jgi:hypothetical protein
MRTWESKQSSVTMPGVSRSYFSRGFSHRRHCRLGRSLETPRLGSCSVAALWVIYMYEAEIYPRANQPVSPDDRDYQCDLEKSTARLCSLLVMPIGQNRM